MMLGIAPYFVKQLVDYQIMTSGCFELSSGEMSDFYYEFGRFSDGKALDAVGFSFLSAAKEYQLTYDIVYGTAYKGILIAMAMSTFAWNRDFFAKGGSDIPWCVERKEVKSRNESGVLIGANITGKKVLLVDDVGTSFESLRKSVKIIQDYDVKSLSILIGVNRGPHTQVEGIPVHQIVTHAEVLELRRRFE